MSKESNRGPKIHIGGYSRSIPSNLPSDINCEMRRRFELDRIPRFRGRCKINGCEFKRTGGCKLMVDMNAISRDNLSADVGNENDTDFDPGV